MLEPGELVVPKDMVAGGAVDHLRGRIPGFQGGGFADPSVPYYAGVGVEIRSALQDVAAQLVQDMQDFAQQVTSASAAAEAAARPCTARCSPPAAVPGHRAAPHASPVAVHVASVSPSVAAGGGITGSQLPMPAAAMKALDAYEKTVSGMSAPWKQFANELLQGLVDTVKNPLHETAKQMQALIGKVQTEVGYGQGVASAAAAGQGYTAPGASAGLLSTFGGLATPTTTAQGQPYQYYTDQANISGGGTVSVQQQMADYLQTEKSFGGDLGKLSKGGLSKGLLQQLIGAGPLQGDQLAQSILGGAGGIKGANSLMAQITKESNALGIQGAESIYGMPKGAAGVHGKAVSVPVHADAAAAQAAIDQIHGKSVTINVKLDISGGGGGGSGGGSSTLQLSPSQVKQVAAQLQAEMLKRAKNNRRTGNQLQGYGA